MRKIITTLFIIAGFYSASNAQITKANAFVFGANIGLNEGYVQESNSLLKSGSVGGFNLGVSGEYYFSDRWSFKAKLNYDQKGWADGYIIVNSGPSGQGSSEIDNINFKLNYLTVPLMANWHFGHTRNWYLHFGPYLGFLMSASDNNGDGDIKPLFNSTDVGFDLGIGVKFPVADRVKLFIEADGQSGFTNIFKDGGGSTVQAQRSSLNFGVTFDMN